MIQNLLSLIKPQSYTYTRRVWQCTKLTFTTTTGLTLIRAQNVGDVILRSTKFVEIIFKSSAFNSQTTPHVSITKTNNLIKTQK